MKYHFRETLNNAVPTAVKSDERSGVMILEGVGFIPLYDHCPKCGCDLQKLYDTPDNKKQAHDIENNTHRTNASEVSGDLSVGSVEVIEHELFSVGVINPLPNTPEEKTDGKQSRGFYGVSGNQASPIYKENESSSDDKNFVPVVNSKFRKWILHVRNFLFTPIGKF